VNVNYTYSDQLSSARLKLDCVGKVVIVAGGYLDGEKKLAWGQGL